MSYLNLSNHTIALEGMPGSGKTSILFMILKYIEKGDLVLPELNLDPNYKPNGHQKENIYNTLWDGRLELLSNNRVINRLFFDRSLVSNLGFTYALDKMQGGREYEGTLEKYGEKALKSVDLFLVFHSSPETSLARRRQQRGENLPFPWNSLEFLQHLSNFYTRVMPEICDNYIFLDTEKKGIKEVEETVKGIIKLSQQTTLCSNEHKKDDFLVFGKKHGLLKEEHSDIVDVFGYPTMYFGKHAVQKLNAEEFVFLNNHRLSHLLRGARV